VSRKYTTREITSPRTGTSYTVGQAYQMRLDITDGRFATVCDTHHTVLNSRTWQLAIDAVFSPEWCEQCQPALGARS